MIEDPYIKDIISKYKCPAFIDSVGTGAIFSSVVSCAVILPENFWDDRINDSKQLEHKNLYNLASELYNKIIYSFGIATIEEINSLKNIVKADQLAMLRAFENLPIKPDALFIDGIYALSTEIQSYPIIKGDAKVLGIATASILAKSYRDHFIMNAYGEKFKAYDVANNKGYRSPRHIVAIKKYGITEYHRVYLNQVQSILNGLYDDIIFKKYRALWESL